MQLSAAVLRPPAPASGDRPCLRGYAVPWSVAIAWIAGDVADDMARAKRKRSARPDAARAETAAPPVRRRVGLWVLACLVALAAVAVAWTAAGGRAPRPWRNGQGWFAAAPSADLPSEWTLEKAPPKVPAALALTQPLGQLPPPFRHPDAAKAWQAWHEGRVVEAARLAEAAWPAVDGAASGAAPSDPAAPDGSARAKAAVEAAEDRWRLALLMTQTRWAQGNKAGAIAAARIASGHPALGIAALRWLVARADDSGLSRVVLALVADRADPSLQVMRARAMRRNGQVKEASAALAALQPPTAGSAWRRWQMERVRTLSAGGDEDGAAAALRELLRKAGKSTVAEDAVDWVLGAQDAVWQKRLQQRPQDAPVVLQALVYTAQRRRYNRATPALEALATQADVGIAVQCHARSWAARTHDRRGALDKALAHYAILRQSCDSEAVRALAIDEDPLGKGDIAFRSGRALALQGKTEGAAQLQQALAEGLTGVDADDARLLIDVLKSTDGPAVLQKQGSTAAADYAERDIIDVAVWRVALERLIDKRWPDALALLERLTEIRDSGAPPTAGATETPRYDDRDWARGRAEYFAARALAELGKLEEAKTRWQRIVQRHPLTYYAQMALAQLQRRGKVDLDVLLAQTRQVEAGPAIDAALLAEPALQRARLLGQLGWHDEAAEELESIGIGRDAGSEDRWAAGDPNRLWTRASVDAEAGRWTASHALGRDQLRAFATAWPREGNRAAWQLAFPRGYQVLMDGAGKEFDVHPSVLYAICRSESGFNPRVESHAHAFGLLQLIVPTAEAMAKGLGVEATPETLKLPATNVRLGARFLKKLLDRFGREQQMAAGYNAGGGAVGRWRKTRGDWPMDLFVETIPFRETRDYAKRVTSAIATYRALYYGERAYALALTQLGQEGEAGDAPPVDGVAAQPEGAASAAATDDATEAPSAQARPTQQAVKPLAKRARGRGNAAPAVKSAPSKSAASRKASAVSAKVNGKKGSKAAKPAKSSPAKVKKRRS